MPKILENIKERAITEARREMLSEGYTAMTVRRVASRLGIGIGTIYNYFPSKEYLAASVMLEDWQARMAAFAQEAAGKDAEETVRRLYLLVQSFSAVYVLAWSQYGTSESAGAMRRRYHTALVEQLSRYIEAALPEEKKVREPWLAGYLAETVLHFASDGESGYEKIRPAVEQLTKI